MNLNKKRGISGVVTAVLLILLVIAAVGILWVVVQNFVTKGSESFSGAADCLETNFEVVSADSVTDTITVRRIGGNAVLSEIRISDGTTSTVATVSSPSVGETSSATDAAFTFAATDSVEVSIAYDLADGTSCQLQNLGSVIVS